MAHPILSSLSSRCRRFSADPRGTSAVEFAVLLPLMLTMYFGSIQITDAISADRQITLVASTVAEILSQSPAPPQGVTPAQVSNIFQAASLVLTPFPVANATVTLSSVKIDQNMIATIAWSQALTGNGRALNSVVTSSIPSGLLIPNTWVIWGEATYNYKPVIGWVITGTLPLYDQIFLRARNSSNVCMVGVDC
jgi:Flp pilus assembly protein TadG